jgi:F-type H+-transporting ATPase subunit b
MVFHWLLMGILSTAHAAEGHEGATATEGHEAAGHAGGHHEVFYTDDDDHDGVANWRDPMNGSEPNTDTYVVKSLAFHTLNFIVFAGIIGYAARRPLVDTFRDRALAIRHELTDSARARDEAHQRHQELLARLDRIETEVRAMEQEAAVDAEREEKKLIERAHREAERISAQAERNIRDEGTRARQELRQEAVRLAVQLAEATLRQGVSSDDQQKLAREFLQTVKGVGDV